MATTTATTTTTTTTELEDQPGDEMIKLRHARHLNSIALSWKRKAFQPEIQAIVKAVKERQSVEYIMNLMKREEVEDDDDEDGPGRRKKFRGDSSAPVAEGIKANPAQKSETSKSQEDRETISNIEQELPNWTVELEPLLGDVGLCAAVEEKYPEVIQTVMDTGFCATGRDWMDIEYSPLPLACHQGYLEGIQILCTGCPDVFREVFTRDSNTKKLQFRNSLHIAIANDDVEVLKILLPFYEIRKKTCPVAYTPLHLACKEGKINCATYLLSRYPEELHVMCGRKMCTPLLYAVTSSPAITGLLLQQGARLDVRNCYQQGPLHLLFHSRITGGEICAHAQESLHLLLEAGLPVNDPMDPPLSIVCRSITSRIPSRLYGRTNWNKTIEEDQGILRDCIMLLLEKGADLNYGDPRCRPILQVFHGIGDAIDTYTSHFKVDSTHITPDKVEEKEKEYEGVRNTALVGLRFCVELLGLMLQSGAELNTTYLFGLYPLQIMFVKIETNERTPIEARESLWPHIRDIFQILLRYGAREFSVDEALRYKPYSPDVLTMALNALPQKEYIKQICVLDNMEELENEESPLLVYKEWAQGLVAKVRKLKELARSEIYTCMGTNLMKGVGKLGIPPKVQKYVLDFS